MHSDAENLSQPAGVSNTTMAFLIGLTLITLIWTWRLRQAETAAVAPPAPAVLKTSQPVLPPPQAADAATILAQKWGISVFGLRLFANGNLVDFRYKILDPAKAAVLTKQEGENAYFLDEASGHRLRLASMGRGGTMYHYTNTMQSGSMFSLQFPNPGKHLHPGSKVTLVMGDFRAENLTVE